MVLQAYWPWMPDTAAAAPTASPAPAPTPSASAPTAATAAAAPSAHHNALPVRLHCRLQRLGTNAVGEGLVFREEALLLQDRSEGLSLGAAATLRPPAFWSRA